MELPTGASESIANMFAMVDQSVPEALHVSNVADLLTEAVAAVEEAMYKATITKPETAVAARRDFEPAPASTEVHVAELS